MTLEPVPFSGLRSLEADELVPLGQALDASDCNVDSGAIVGRSGYRNAITSNAAVGTGTAQGIARFRPSASAARTVIARGGNIYAMTDPASETGTVSAPSATGSDVFGLGGSAGAALVSMAQLGQELYIACDQAAPMIRMLSDFSLESLTPLPAADKPTGTVSAFPSILVFTSAGTITGTGGAGVGTINTDWTEVTDGAAGNCPLGGAMKYAFAAAQDWRYVRWVAVMVAPPTAYGGGSGGRVSIQASANGTTWEEIGVTFDSVDDHGGSGSSSLIYCDVTGLTAATRAAVTHVRFVMQQATDKFAVYGLLAIPMAPVGGDATYFITFYNSSNTNESPQSQTVTVNASASDVTMPQFHAIYRDGSSWVEAGQLSTDPGVIDIQRCHNKDVGKALPVRTDFGKRVQVSGNIPSGSQYSAADTARLWKLTATGYRLAGTLAYAGGVTTYSFYDTAGDYTLSAQSYIAGGTPPPCSAMAARGGRLIVGGDPTNPNRLSISSFTPFGQTTDPFPKFPAIGILSSDGWSFDIGPSAAEQVLWLGNGDALYIGTNEAMYLMTDLSPNSPPFKVCERGVIGRRAAVFADLGATLFWCAHDGIYMGENRASVTELSAPIRRLFSTWFLPDSTVVMGYQDRKLIAIRGTRYLRYDFVTQTWTRGTLAHTMSHGAGWRDPSGTYVNTQQLWYLDSGGKIMRWQASATTDAGTAISAWSYSTGYDVQGQKTKLDFLFLDASGAVTVNAYKDSGTTGPPAKTFASGEHEFAVGPNVTAYKWRLLLAAANTVAVRRLMWQRTATEGRGG